MEASVGGSAGGYVLGVGSWELGHGSWSSSHVDNLHGVTHRMRDILNFVVEFIRRPKNTGAIAPSSPALARCIVEGLGIEEASLVVEYGPGSGAFTGEIIRRMPEGADFVAIENNERMIAMLRERHPEAEVVHGSIADAPSILEARGYGRGSVDAIVSGLPWASFGEGLQERLLDATMEILGSGGSFATFAYIHGLVLPTARAFREKLEGRFGEVGRSGIVWGNVPPAFVYRCSV